MCVVLNWWGGGINSFPLTQSCLGAVRGGTLPESGRKSLGVWVLMSENVPAR